MTKAILFDFGGTIDTGGDHWAIVLHELYLNNGIDISEAQYYQAFSHAEKQLAIKRIIQPQYNFYQTLIEKIKIQFDFLKEAGWNLKDEQIQKIAQQGYEIAKENCAKHAAIIETLKKKYLIGLVSNFYGNLHAVLDDFNICYLFDSIVESAVVGVRKPDAAIFHLCAVELNVADKECVVVGDTLNKDILPGASLNMKTIWLKNKTLDQASKDNIPSETIIVHQFENIPQHL